MAIAIFSCANNKKTKIRINNNTNYIIDSLVITYGTEKESKKYIKSNINSKEIIDTTFNMNMKGIDGVYFLEAFQKNRTLEKSFGYYSNAVFKNNTFNLVIQKDTIVVSEIMK